MSLLREIQDSAAASDVSTVTLLRKCKILAARLGSADLGLWVNCELNGYEDAETLPEYREMSAVESLGNFVGAFGRQMNNAPIPSFFIDEKLRHLVESIKLRQAIPIYEDLLRSDQQDSFRVPWPANLLPFVGTTIVQGFSCMQAWKVLPRGKLVQIVESVRDRVLNFALELELQYPESGDAPLGSNPVPEPILRQVVNNNFYSSVGNVAAASHNVEQTTHLPGQPRAE